MDMINMIKRFILTIVFSFIYAFAYINEEAVAITLFQGVLLSAFYMGLSLDPISNYYIRTCLCGLRSLDPKIYSYVFAIPWTFGFFTLISLYTIISFPVVVIIKIVFNLLFCSVVAIADKIVSTKFYKSFTLITLLFSFLDSHLFHNFNLSVPIFVFLSLEQFIRIFVFSRVDFKYFYSQLCNINPFFYNYIRRRLRSDEWFNYTCNYFQLNPKHAFIEKICLFKKVNQISDEYVELESSYIINGFLISINCNGCLINVNLSSNFRKNEVFNFTNNSVNRIKFAKVLRYWRNNPEIGILADSPKLKLYDHYIGHCCSLEDVIKLVQDDNYDVILEDFNENLKVLGTVEELASISLNLKVSAIKILKSYTTEFFSKEINDQGCGPSKYEMLFACLIKSRCVLYTPYSIGSSKFKVYCSDLNHLIKEMSGAENYYIKKSSHLKPSQICLKYMEKVSKENIKFTKSYKKATNSIYKKRKEVKKMNLYKSECTYVEPEEALQFLEKTKDYSQGLNFDCYYDWEKSSLKIKKLTKDLKPIPVAKKQTEAEIEAAFLEHVEKEVTEDSRVKLLKNALDSLETSGHRNIEKRRENLTKLLSEAITEKRENLLNNKFTILRKLKPEGKKTGFKSKSELRKEAEKTREIEEKLNRLRADYIDKVLKVKKQVECWNSFNLIKKGVSRLKIKDKITTIPVYLENRFNCLEFEEADYDFSPRDYSMKNRINVDEIKGDSKPIPLNRLDILRELYEGREKVFVEINREKRGERKDPFNIISLSEEKTGKNQQEVKGSKGKEKVDEVSQTSDEIIKNDSNLKIAECFPLNFRIRNIENSRSKVIDYLGDKMKYRSCKSINKLLKVLSLNDFIDSLIGLNNKIESCNTAKGSLYRRNINIGSSVFKELVPKNKNVVKLPRIEEQIDEMTKLFKNQFYMF